MSFIIFLCALFVHASAQKPVIVEQKEPAPTGIQVTTTRNSAIISGKKVDYTTQSGYLELKNDTGKVIAKVFFTYYKTENLDLGKRPLTFAFNGGPGSSSVWLHLGALGPKKVQL